MEYLSVIKVLATFNFNNGGSLNCKLAYLFH